MKPYIKFFQTNKFFYNYKKTVVDFFKNLMSFSLLIAVQQIIALPLISRCYDIETFGKIVLVFGISNIMSSAFGFSIGNSRLLDDRAYNVAYIRLLHISNIFILGACTILYSYVFSVAFVEGLIFSITCIIGNIRLFITSEFRIKDVHDPILKQNIYYSIGIFIGISVFYYFKNWMLVFFIAEASSVILTYIIFLREDNFFRKFVDKEKLNLSNNFQLMLNNGISYSLSQYDRLIIYPLLGATSVSMYYSISVSARIGGLILNPLSNFILGKLASKQREIKPRTINLFLLFSILTTIIYFFMTVITTPLLVWALYPDFLPTVRHLISPICLGAALMGGSTVLKPVIMKYIGVKFYNIAFVIYGFLLVTLSIVLCLKYGLIGLAIANLISSSFLNVFLFVGLKFFNRIKNY